MKSFLKITWNPHEVNMKSHIVLMKSHKNSPSEIPIGISHRNLPQVSGNPPTSPLSSKEQLSADPLQDVQPGPEILLRESAVSINGGYPKLAGWFLWTVNHGSMVNDALYMVNIWFIYMVDIWLMVVNILYGWWLLIYMVNDDFCMVNIW